jgi:AraC family transcriptional regulator
MAPEDRHAGNSDFVRSRLGPIGYRQSGLFFANRPLALHAMLSSAGYEKRTTTDYDWHGLKRGTTEFVLFQYTIAGRGRLSYAGRQHSVEAGQAMLLFFPFDNRYWLADGDSWEHFFLCLHGREVMRATRTIIAKRGPLIALDADSLALETSLDACAQILRDQVKTQFTASALAYGLCMHLLAETCGETAPAPRATVIEKAKDYARKHFASDIGVDDLAQAAGLSRYHFSRQFAASEGTSPAAYVADLRIRAAARLLRDSEMPIAVVGARCGFADPAYFCRAFRRAVGVSPGEFRNSGMY